MIGLRERQRKLCRCSAIDFSDSKLITGRDAVWHVLRPEVLSRAEAERVVNRFFGDTD